MANVLSKTGGSKILVFVSHTDNLQRTEYRMFDLRVPNLSTAITVDKVTEYSV